MVLFGSIDYVTAFLFNWLHMLHCAQLKRSKHQNILRHRPKLKGPMFSAGPEGGSTLLSCCSERGGRPVIFHWRWCLSVWWDKGQKEKLINRLGIKSGYASSSSVCRSDTGRDGHETTDKGPDIKDIKRTKQIQINSTGNVHAFITHLLSEQWCAHEASVNALLNYGGFFFSACSHNFYQRFISQWKRSNFIIFACVSCCWLIVVFDNTDVNDAHKGSSSLCVLCQFPKGITIPASSSFSAHQTRVQTPLAHTRLGISF